MPSPNRSKRPAKKKIKLLLVDFEDNDVMLFDSIGEVREHLQDLAEHENLNADDMQDQFQLFEAVREIDLVFEDRSSVDVIIRK